MKIAGIHHIAIICSDYERSKQFYVDVLGFSIIRETYREARQSYKLDLHVDAHTQVELFSFPNPPNRLQYPEACGLRHLALAVEDLDGAIADLTANGVTVEPVRLDELTGKRFAFFKDPDHLPLELYEVD
ncbi:SMU1112c/YaeR family gloxylase I-like metalloprotein [Vacuolonema iberomarrocanum]|uniref:SMU1112c/YaeR family gloxylase I-like metalloprotein n=1 Tax=Vacuolonema iberomarrocanum TaxID=3454632 RepID=UPI0019E75AB7|nr:VOC family protein [filamentous cyanobacterium LEGE 07170]